MVILSHLFEGLKLTLVVMLIILSVVRLTVFELFSVYSVLKILRGAGEFSVQVSLFLIQNKLPEYCFWFFDYFLKSEDCDYAVWFERLLGGICFVQLACASPVWAKLSVNRHNNLLC